MLTDILLALLCPSEIKSSMLASQAHFSNGAATVGTEVPIYSKGSTVFTADVNWGWIGKIVYSIFDSVGYSKNLSFKSRISRGTVGLLKALHPNRSVPSQHRQAYLLLWICININVETISRGPVSNLWQITGEKHYVLKHWFHDIWRRGVHLQDLLLFKMGPSDTCNSYGLLHYLHNIKTDTQ